jgi:hypothetical protein
VGCDIFAVPHPPSLFINGEGGLGDLSENLPKSLRRRDFAKNDAKIYVVKNVKYKLIYA